MSLRKHICAAFKLRDHLSRSPEFLMSRAGNGDHFGVTCLKPSALSCIHYSLFLQKSTEKYTVSQTISSSDTLLSPFITCNALFITVASVTIRRLLLPVAAFPASRRQVLPLRIVSGITFLPGSHQKNPSSQAHCTQEEGKRIYRSALFNFRLFYFFFCKQLQGVRFR